VAVRWLIDRDPTNVWYWHFCDLARSSAVIGMVWYWHFCDLARSSAVIGI